MIPNVARFKINNTASEDGDGDRGFDTTANTTLTLTLEKNPAVDAITVTYEIPDPNNSDSPKASLFYTDNVFVQNSARKITLTNPNASVTIVVSPASDISSFPIRCSVVTARGVQVFERLVCIRKSGLRMTVPAERQEYGGRGWSDALNELTKALADGGVTTPLASTTEIGVVSAFPAGTPRVLTSNGATAGGVWVSYATLLTALLPAGAANTVLWSDGASNTFTGSPRVSTSLAVGATPAATGAVRLTATQAVKSRNNSNGADIELIKLNGSDQVTVGDAGTGATIVQASAIVAIAIGANTRLNIADTISTFAHTGGNVVVGGGYISVGANAAATGVLRIANLAAIKGRNFANNADFNLISVTAANQILVGDPAADHCFLSSTALVAFIVGGASRINVANSYTAIIPDGTNIRFTVTDTTTTFQHTGGNVVVGGGYVNTGANPSVTGFIRNSNNTVVLTARNAVNSADINLIKTSTANVITVGDAGNAATLELAAAGGVSLFYGANVRLTMGSSEATFQYTGANVRIGGGYITTGAIPADAGGMMRLTYGLANGVVARNQANGGNVSLISLDSAGATHDYVRVGPTAVSVAIGALNTSTVYLGGDGNGGVYNTAFVSGGVYLSAGAYSILNGVANMAAYRTPGNAADAGLLRGLNNTVLVAARNAANDANISVLSTDASDRVGVGGANALNVFGETSYAKQTLVPRNGNNTVREDAEYHLRTLDSGTNSVSINVDMTAFGVSPTNGLSGGFLEVEIICHRSSSSAHPHYWKGVFSWVRGASSFTLGDVVVLASSFNAVTGAIITTVTAATFGVDISITINTNALAFFRGLLVKTKHRRFNI